LFATGGHHEVCLRSNSPSSFVDIPKEGKGKECCEAGEGDDTVTIEDTSDEEDGEMLQE
jgi:hypothetical protein